MLAIVEPRRPRRGARALRAVGDPRDGRRPRHRHRRASASSTACSTRSACRARTRRRRTATSRPSSRRTAPPVADVPVDSLGDGPLYHAAAARARGPGRARRPPIPRAALAARVSRRRRPRRRAARAARDADDRRQVVGVAPVRPPALPQHRRRPGRRRRRAPAEGHRRRRSRSSTDGKARFCRLDPRTGARLAVLEAARNVACAGAAPAGARQLPQLRQPRAPRGDVAVLRGRRRA